MARPKSVKNLTPAEVKALKKELTGALKSNAATLKPLELAGKEAGKALTEAKKEADKLVQAAQKAVDTAQAKLVKAQDAAAKGAEKINARLAELDALELTTEA